MENKKGLIIILIPIIVIGILVIIKSLNKNNFSVDAKQTLELSQDQEHILSVKQLKEKLQPTNKITLVDLRIPAEFTTAHLKDALNIPFAEILNNQKLGELKSFDNEIIIYSNSIIESSKASILLMQIGFKNLHILDIPGDLISEQILETDTILESNELLKFKFQPDSVTGLE